MNKNIYLIVAIIVSMFSSCSDSEYRKGLTEVDSISSVNPQRAMAMLNSMKQEMEDAPEHEQMYYKLLCIKAPDKAYIKHTSDSMILKLLEYYETNGDKNLLPEAYYYAGKVYCDLNDAPKALEYYQKSEETLPKNADLYDFSKLYNQKGTLFLFQYLNKEAIKQFKMSYKYECLRKDTAMMVYSLKNIAFAFGEEKKLDSCLFYYQKAYNLAIKLNDTIVISNIMGQIASFYVKNKDFDKAKKYLIPILVSNDKENKSAYYSIAANMYMNIGKYDSAFFYCKELLNNGSIYAKQNASRRLAYIYIEKKDFPNAKKYLKLSQELSDSVKAITATESVNRMNSLYNYTLREKENLVLKAENANKKFIFTIIMSVVVILLLALIVYIFNNRQKQKRQAEQINRLKKELYRQSEEYIQQNRKKIEALEQELKITSSENQMLVKRIEEQRSDLMLANEAAIRKKEINESAKARITATDIYKTIQDHIKKEKVISAKEWNALEEVFNQKIVDFKDNLYSYHNISQHEYHICMLIRLDFSPKELSILLGCTTSAISKARKRLHEKFFSDQGTAKDFDCFIKTL